MLSNKVVPITPIEGVNLSRRFEDSEEEAKSKAVVMLRTVPFCGSYLFFVNVKQRLEGELGGFRLLITT